MNITGSGAFDNPSNRVPIGLQWLLPIALAVLLVIVSFQNYLLFHTLAELFAIIVAILAAVVIWQTYSFSRNHFLMYLGCGYIWVAVLDVMHTLLYKGMSIFPITVANPATQFWIGARYVEALLLLTAPLFLSRSFNRYIATSLFGVVAVILYVLIMSGNFPDAFIEEEGLTPFKVVSEYVIIGLLMGALVYLWRQRLLLDRRVLILITGAIILTTCAEVTFTLYVTVYGFPNLVGHIFKLFSFWFIYEAIVANTLKEPVRVMSGNLLKEIEEHKRTELALSKSEEKHRLAMNATQDGLWDWDVTTGSVYFSPAWGHILDLDDLENNYATWEERIHPEDKPRLQNSLNLHLAGETTIWQEEHRLRRRDGAWTWVLGRGQVVERDPDGNPLRMIGTMTDINERKLVEEAHQNAEEKFSSLLNSAAEGIYGVDTEGLCTFANPACLRILGYDNEAQLLGQNMHNLIHHTKVDGSHHPVEECRILQAFRLGEGTHVDNEILWRKDGTIFPVEYWSYPLRQNSTVIGAVVSFFDITDRLQAEAEREQLLHDMDQRVKELRCMFGIAENIRKHTKLEDILYDTVRAIPAGWHYPEYTKARIILDDKAFFESPFSPTEWKQASDLVIGNEYRGSVEVYYTKEFPELDEGPFMKHERKLVNAIARTISEAIERKQAEAELEYLVTHDALTGLYNRKVFEQRITKEILRAARYDHALSIFMLDIDHFKRINDTYGHRAGDSVLRSFAGVLKSSIRNTDYAARYGGEEFTIILPESPLAEAEELAERLRNQIAEHSIPLEDDKELNITASIGIATFPEHAKSWEGLLEAADTAMYVAKSKGRNCVETADSAG